jgi:hypothetical protein
MKRAALYLRVSTVDQKTANQERELREVAGRIGWEITKVYKDHGISGAKGRDKRAAFDALCRDATQRRFDVVMAWSVDRLGRSLQDAQGGFIALHAAKGGKGGCGPGKKRWPTLPRHRRCSEQKRLSAQYSQRRRGRRSSPIATKVCTSITIFIAIAVRWPSSA